MVHGPAVCCTVHFFNAAMFMFCAAEVLGDKRSVFFLNAAAFRSQASSAQDCSNEPGVVWSFQVVWEW